MHGKRKLLIISFVLVALAALPSHFPSASEAPEVIELNALGNIYEPVTFDHLMHMDFASCTGCHHAIDGMAAEDENCLRCHQERGSDGEITCAGCHPADPGKVEKMKAASAADLFHTDLAGLKRAYHVKCLGCHQEMDAPSGCEDCHPRRDAGR